LTDTSFHTQLVPILAYFDENRSYKHCLTLTNDLINQALMLELCVFDDNRNVWNSIRTAEISYRVGLANEWWIENSKNLYDLFTTDSNKILNSVSYRIIKEDGITSLIPFKHSSAPAAPQDYARLLDNRDSLLIETLGL
jgi:hypothetical protein